MIWRCDLVPQYRKFKPSIDSAIETVLFSGRYVLAEQVAAFEQEFAAYNGVEYVVGAANGTDGLILALQAFDVGPGDEVITAPFSPIPTVSAILAVGATPVFVDICEDSYLMDLQKIPEAITSKTRVILPVHIFGNVLDIPLLQTLVGPGISIIEDACQAHGSMLHGRKAGSLGDSGVFSFYPTKNLGGYGDGGAIMTNNKDLAEKIRLLRMYGMTDKDHSMLPGINSRLDEIQAAVLRVKLPVLDAMNAQRHRIAQQYIQRLDASRWMHQHIAEEVFSNYHVFVSRFVGNRERLIAYLDAHGIQTNIYYPIPLHSQKILEFIDRKSGAFPVVEKLCQEVIALPMYAELEDHVLETVIDCINEFRG
ncbi:MAG: DegT/DnrJ/EryC1/StrS family aminotransferase [bacterium]|nr:DegT/DnrJ/EryC1/StrS family aminotransferase [bacterium]